MRFFQTTLLAISSFILGSFNCLSQNITTVAGGIGTTANGNSVGLCNPYSIATDAGGNAYVADACYHVVRRITPTGNVMTVAGNGAAGYSGNGAAATLASLNSPMGVAVDAKGNLYISENGNNIIRKVDTAGNISLFAGSFVAGSAGDGLLATAAQLHSPLGICFDNKGALLISDLQNNKIRRVDTFGLIHTIAGTGAAAFGGDDSMATHAWLNGPSAVTVDRNGNIFIADRGNARIRKVDTSGIITTICGNGISGFSADGIIATAAELNFVCGLTTDTLGRLYIGDSYSNKIRRIDTSGVINLFAGGGTVYPGDGDTATLAILLHPQGLAFDKWGNLFVAAGDDRKVKLVDTNHILLNVAGNVTECIAGDGGAATAAQVFDPVGVVVDGAGNFYVSEPSNNYVKKISNTGVISVYAGNGIPGYSGDNGPATAAKLSQPAGLAINSAGDLFIADMSNYSIRKVATDGTITTIAGHGVLSVYSDNVAATTTSLDLPWSVFVSGDNKIYVSEYGGNRVRMIDGSGIIHLVAGNGTHSYCGDSAPATDACLNQPYGICVDSAGNVYIADQTNHRVRKVDTSGIIGTLIGTGTPGYSGDFGNATTAAVSAPYDVKMSHDGALLVSDAVNQCVRRVGADSIITTVVGTGIPGFSGDGDLAVLAQLQNPKGMAFDPWGDLFIADMGNNRVRKVGNYAPNSVSTLQQVEKLLQVYPNPSTGKFVVMAPGGKNEQVTIVITDIFGKMVGEVHGVANLEQAVSIAAPAGVYVVQCHSSSGSFYQKLILNH